MPQVFPRQYFRITQQQAPQRDVVPIHRALAPAPRAHKVLELQKSFLRALERNPALAPLALAELAKACDAPGIARRAAMTRPDGIRERALALRTPHNSVQLVGPPVVFSQIEKKVSVTGVVQAQRGRVPAVQVLFL